jgi:hypothetical protein
MRVRDIIEEAAARVGNDFGVAVEEPKNSIEPTVTISYAGHKTTRRISFDLLMAPDHLTGVIAAMVNSVKSRN